MDTFNQLVSLGQKIEQLGALASAIRVAEACHLTGGGTELVPSMRRQVVFDFANESQAKALIDLVKAITAGPPRPPAIQGALFSKA